MFVKNASSVKRKTIRADDDLKRYLCYHGQMPLSKDGDEWIFLSNDRIIELVRQYKKGGTSSCLNWFHFLLKKMM
jgi:hypothetical protein